MTAAKDVMTMSDQQILDLVELEFNESAEDRREKNWQNYLWNKTFLAIDLDKSAMPEVGDSNFGLGLGLAESTRNEHTPGPIRSKIYMPYARAIILTAKNMLAQAIYPNNADFFSVHSMREGEDAGAAKFQSFAHYDMRRGGYQDEAEMAIERSLVYDFQLFMVDWESDFMWAPDIQDIFHRTMGDDGKPVAVGNPIGKKIEYKWKAGARSGTSFTAPSTFAVRHDPMAIHGPISPRTCEWVGLEYKMSWRRLLDMAKSGEYTISKVKAAQKEGGPPDSVEVDFDAMIRADLRLQAQRRGKHYNPANPTQDAESHAEIRDRWDWTSRVTVVNRKWVIRKKRSVGIPFVKLVTYPTHGQFGGVPMIADLQHIQIDVNTMLRLRRDAQNNAVNKTLIVDDTAFRNPEEADKIRLNPLEAIHVTPALGRTVLDSVNWIKPPEAGTETITEQNNELQFAERMTKVSDTAQGLIANTGRRTATEHELAAGGTARATGFNARTLERQIVSGVAQLMLIQYNLRLTKEEKYRVIGAGAGEWKTVHPEDFYFGILPEIVPLGLSGEQSRSLELDLFMRGVKMMAEIPPFSESTDWPNLQRELWSKLRVSDVDRLIKGNGQQGVDIPQEMENILIRSGHYIAPKPNQDHDAHMQQLAEYAQTPDFAALPPDHKSLLVRHNAEHQMLLQAKEQPQVAQGPGASAGGGGGTPGPERTPNSTGEQVQQANRAQATRNSGG